MKERMLATRKDGKRLGRCRMILVTLRARADGSQFCPGKTAAVAVWPHNHYPSLIPDDESRGFRFCRNNTRLLLPRFLWIHRDCLYCIGELVGVLKSANHWGSLSPVFSKSSSRLTISAS